MSERNVLASVIRSRDAFTNVERHITDEDFSEQGKVILHSVQKYYDRDPHAQSCDPDLLRTEIHRSLSNPKHQEMFADILKSITGTDVSPANVIHDFIAQRRDVAGSKLATVLAAGRNSDAVRPALDEYLKWDAAQGLESADEGYEVVQGLDVFQLIEDNYSDAGLIRILPDSLNERLDGGLLRGHHLLVFARPEMGKTLLVVQMIAGFLEQNLSVLYIGNEDPIPDVVKRVIGNLTGMTWYEINEDPAEADALARERGYDNLVLAGLAPGTPYEIQALIAEYKPDVVVIDQLRNINVGEEHFVQKLEKAATAARNMAKSNNVLMVSVTQAGDSASGKGPLDMGDVDSSNTGIPAQVDVMVGVGATADDEVASRRILSLPKNKRSGRHEFFPVGIDSQTSRVRTLG